MPTHNFPELASQSTLQQLQKSIVIFKNARKSVTAFYNSFEKSKHNPNKKPNRGGTTDQQQDLLRAMLLFATAGLDAVVKQLIKDALRDVIDKDAGAQDQFATFVTRKLKKSDAETTSGAKMEVLNIPLLAEVIASNNIREKLIQKLVKAITDNSLQSQGELLKAAAHFAITPQQILPDDQQVPGLGAVNIDSVFIARNQIAHEMDIKLDARNRSRRTRKQAEMTILAGLALSTAAVFISTVESKLSL